MKQKFIYSFGIIYGVIKYKLSNVTDIKSAVLKKIS